MPELAAVELQIELQNTSRGSLRAQLELGLKQAVHDGRLRPGGRLPPSRILARQLGISRGVVVGAYESLVAAGYFVSRQGIGTEVAAAPELDAAGIDFSTRFEPAGTRWDLRAGFPDLSSFPRGDWLRAMETVVRRIPYAYFGYGDGRGVLELRNALATRLGRTRGIVPAPERIVITTGSTQGHQLAFRVLAEWGVSSIAIEDPGWHMQQTAAQDARLRTIPVPVDGHGLDVDRLAASGADAVVVTPAHHFPFGVPLSPERRAALLEWARATGAIVVEDDYDTEFRFDTKPAAALQAEHPDGVISIGTASKSLAPALRLGWVLFPAELASLGAKIKERMDSGSPALEQLTYAELIESGRLDRHLRRMAARYERRRRTLVDALAAELPGARVMGIAAGLHVAVALPAELDEQAVLDAAAERGILIRGVGRYRFDTPNEQPILELGYANLPEESMVSAIRALAEAVRVASPS
jgi:GntR family transcriptional regulator/MocR family aminotransferase